jgi:hypothetical protein
MILCFGVGRLSLGTDDGGRFGHPGADGFELFAGEGMRESCAPAHLRHLVCDICLTLKNAAAMFEADANRGAICGGIDGIEIGCWRFHEYRKTRRTASLRTSIQYREAPVILRSIDLSLPQ